jgi:hypothetical protein
VKDLEELQKTWLEAMEAQDLHFAELVKNCDPETRLAVTQWVMNAIVDHAQEGGSYRYLIYNRLGFGPEAYVPLCSSGLTISNEFDLNAKDRVIKAWQSGDETLFRATLGLCDEPGCFNQISCGTPTPTGYRSTCHTHYPGDKQ